SCLTLLLSLTSLFTSACFPLSLHDALPISGPASFRPWWCSFRSLDRARGGEGALAARYRTPGRGLLRYRDRSSHQRPDLLPHRCAHLLAEGAGEMVAVAEHRGAADHGRAGLGVAEVPGAVHAVHLVPGLRDRGVLGPHQILPEGLLPGDRAGRRLLEVLREALVRAAALVGDVPQHSDLRPVDLLERGGQPVVPQRG